MPKRPTRDALPDELPEWERVLSAAATHAGHRLSRDAGHVLTDLRGRFDRVLADLESVLGTARVNRPLLGSLDLESIRQLTPTLEVERLRWATRSRSRRP